VLFPAQAELMALPLDQACAQSDLVVVGTLEKLKSFIRGEGEPFLEGVDAEIRVKEVLFGAASKGPLPIRWVAARGPVCPRIDHTAQAGRERIWCLTRGEEGFYRANHPQRVLPVSDRAEVEKALQARLAGFLKTLSALASLEDFAGKHVPGPAQVAVDGLAAAGSAALPGAQGLLADGRPVQRVLGCWLASRLREETLAPALEALLEDLSPVQVPCNCQMKDSRVSDQAREALGTLAGKNFESVGRARAWVDGVVGAGAVLQYEHTGGMKGLQQALWCLPGGKMAFRDRFRRREGRLNESQLKELNAFLTRYGAFEWRGESPRETDGFRDVLIFRGTGREEADPAARTRILDWARALMDVP
jgi:hypothetical protein